MIQYAVQEELHRIAPHIEFGSVDTGEDLQEEFDLDSMDFLHLVTALGKRFDIPVPEVDYPRLRSVDALYSYVDEAATRKRIVQ